MFETITKHVRENSVVRFLLSHLIILLAALLICAVGFRSAFVIVRNDVLDSTKFAMTQAVSSVDNGLTELRTLGMQTARSESIYRLENLCHTDDNYYQNIIRAINEYYQRMLYYSPNWVNNTFIYLNSMVLGRGYPLGYHQFLYFRIPQRTECHDRRSEEVILICNNAVFHI